MEIKLYRTGALETFDDINFFVYIEVIQPQYCTSSFHEVAFSFYYIYFEKQIQNNFNLKIIIHYQSSINYFVLITLLLRSIWCLKWSVSKSRRNQFLKNGGRISLIENQSNQYDSTRSDRVATVAPRPGAVRVCIPLLPKDLTCSAGPFTIARLNHPLSTTFSNFYPKN